MQALDDKQLEQRSLSYILSSKSSIHYPLCEGQVKILLGICGSIWLRPTNCIRARIHYVILVMSAVPDLWPGRQLFIKKLV